MSVVAQTVLAVALLAATAGSYVALSPPRRPSLPLRRRPVHDTLGGLRLASQATTNACMAPIGLLALHTVGLALHLSRRGGLGLGNRTDVIPAVLLRHGAQNGLSVACITWSAATVVPLVLILGVGVPLRLHSYASLGHNFTFTLAEPDRLTITGLYRYVQHPSYVGVVVLVAANAALFLRTDGVLSCWIPPAWYGTARALQWVVVALGALALAAVGRLRLLQEEDMLQAKFGAEWETWHTRTARFIPFLL